MANWNKIFFRYTIIDNKIVKQERIFGIVLFSLEYRLIEMAILRKVH